MNDTGTKNDIRFLYEVLERRGNDGNLSNSENESDAKQTSSKNFRKQRANLRRGVDETTEHYAYPYVFPVLGSDATAFQRRALVRMAAISAEFVDVPPVASKGNRKSFGRWCSEVSAALASQRDGERVLFNPDKPDVVAQRIAFLHTQDFEEAVRSIWRIMQLAQGLKPVPACDYISLYGLLCRWGNGVSEESRSVRMSVLRDYYGNATNPSLADQNQ